MTNVIWVIIFDLFNYTYNNTDTTTAGLSPTLQLKHLFMGVF